MKRLRIGFLLPRSSQQSESAGEPCVVARCSLPGFKGVPDAPLLLAEYFREAAQRAAQVGPRVEPTAEVA